MTDEEIQKIVHELCDSTELCDVCPFTNICGAAGNGYEKIIRRALAERKKK